MSFAPVIPVGGIAGWNFLNRTLEKQKAAAASDPVALRDEQYFRTKISSITTAEQLVSDHRLLKVALGAFGLGSDIKNKYFIRKALEEGTSSKTALANKLTDKSYAKLADAFGFATGATLHTKESGFADTIIKKYNDRQFESAVGEQNDSMRLALNARRELTELAASTSSDDTKWYKILGSSPLRSVFQTAFGLPSKFASIDLEQQVSTLKSKMKSAFGDDTIGQLKDPDRLEKFLRNFLVRSQFSSTSVSTSTSSALTILQGSGGSQGILNLLT